MIFKTVIGSMHLAPFFTRKICISITLFCNISELLCTRGILLHSVDLHFIVVSEPLFDDTIISLWYLAYKGRLSTTFLLHYIRKKTSENLSPAENRTRDHWIHEAIIKYQGTKPFCHRANLTHSYILNSPKNATCI